MKVTNKFYTKDGLIQSFAVEYVAGDTQQIEAAYPVPADAVAGQPHAIKTPWHAILSIDSVYDIVQHHGAAAPELNVIKNKVGTELRYVENTGMWRLFMKDRSSATSFGLTAEALRTKKTLEMFDVNPTEGTIGYQFNMDVTDQRSRILNSGLLDDHHYIDDYCSKYRSIYPKIRTHTQRSHEVCVTLMPPKVGGKARWDKYEKFQTGAWVLWAEDGIHGIKRNETLYANEWIISATDAILIDGQKLIRGLPYKLESQKISLAPNTNMILHIKELV
jgi:hypothetical protein